MITKDGAVLVATLLPIGVLLLALESKALIRLIRPTAATGRWLMAIPLMLTVGAALLATAACAICVCADVPVDGWIGILVWISGLALLAVVAGVLMVGVAVSVLDDE